MVRNPCQETGWRNGKKTAEGMMLNFAESGHPVFRTSSFLERGESIAKEKE